MKIILLILCALTGTCIAGTDYASRFEEMKAKGQSKDAEVLLRKWRQNEPNDPDAWIWIIALQTTGVWCRG